MRTVLLALAVPAICLAQVAQPRLTLATTQHDFGRISPDQPVNYRFLARNTGTDTLTILDLKPTCGCTSTVVGRHTLAPGESTELEVSFNPLGMSGVVHKSVQVLSNDPKAPSQTLSFQAEVAPVAFPLNQEIVLEGLAPNELRKRSILITSGTQSPLRVAAVELSPSPWLGVATREEGKNLWVDLELLTSRLPPDKVQGVDSVTLRLSNPNPVAANLTVRWERIPLINISPAWLAWAEPAGRELRARLVLTQPGHQPFRILATRTSNPLFTVAAPPEPTADRQEVEVLLAASAAPGHYEEKAFLTLDTPGHPELEVRLSATLR
jgi:hypothetical protein